MTSAGDRHGPVEDGRRGPTAGPMAVMRPLEVVEAYELLEASIERRPVGEVVAPKHDAPVLAEDRLLQPLHEAVRPGVAGLDSGVTDAEGGADLIEGRLELATAVGQHPLDRPAGALEERNHDVAQEGRDGLVRRPQKEPRFDED